MGGSIFVFLQINSIQNIGYLKHGTRNYIWRHSPESHSCNSTEWIAMLSISSYPARSSCLAMPKDSCEMHIGNKSHCDIRLPARVPIPKVAKGTAHPGAVFQHDLFLWRVVCVSLLLDSSQSMAESTVSSP